MFILPVIDLRDGVVVRGVAGRRDEYRPVESRLCGSADPADIAAAIRNCFGITDLYVADLDAIQHARPDISLYRRLTEAGSALWIDAGIRTADDLRCTLAAGACRAIIGLETCDSPRLLRDLCREFGSEQLVFSLDLSGGRPLADPDVWGDDPRGIAEAAAAAGIRQIIVLDLQQVGTKEGPATIPLCRTIRQRWPDVAVITGGGVRNADDLHALRRSGVDGVLLASALHDGNLTRADLAD